MGAGRDLCARRKDGSEVRVEIGLNPIETEKGVLVLAAIVDLTERKRLESALRSLQRIAAAAHEANVVDEAMQVCRDEVCAFTGWPVGHVYALAEDGRGDLVPTKLWHLDDPARFDIFRRVTEKTRFAQGIGLPGRVLAAAKPAWISDVTKDLNFARAGPAQDIGVRAGFAFPVLVGKEVAAVLEFFAEAAAGPDRAVLELMAHVSTQLGRVIERDYEAEPEPPYCDRPAIEQVFLNIIKNAAHATAQSPTLPRRLTLRSRRERAYVCVEFEDNGPGMDEATRRRVFEPFFTTKPPGVGTGLGLSVSYFIVVEQHGGDIQLMSMPGRGTCFVIRLPLRSKAPRLVTRDSRIRWPLLPV